jgi:hypothetical protein
MIKVITKNFKFGLWYIFSAITCCLIFDGLSEQIYDIVQKRFGIDNFDPASEWIVPLIILVSGIVAFFASWILYKRKVGAAVVFWIITSVIAFQIIVAALLWDNFKDNIEYSFYKLTIPPKSEFSFEYENYNYYYDEDVERLYRLSYHGSGYYTFQEADKTYLNPILSYQAAGNISKVYVTDTNGSNHKFYLITADGKIYSSNYYNWF